MKCRCVRPVAYRNKPNRCRTCGGTVSLARATYVTPHEDDLIQRARDKVFEDKARLGERYGKR